MILSIGQIGLTVNEIESSTEFYRDVLKLEYLFSAPPKLAFFGVNGIRLMLAEPEDQKEGIKNSPVYFTVDDIDQTFRYMKERNVDIIDNPHIIAKLGDREVWMFFIADNSGNTLGLMQEKISIQ